MHNTSPAGRRSPIRAAGRVALVATVAAAAVAGVGVAAASASTTSDTVTVEAFRETVKPWDSISIPSLYCPTGSYLKNEDLSPGRIVPKGVQVVEPGGVGVHISHILPITVTDWWRKPYHLTKGTDGAKPHSTATNWDPFSSHELVINLVCTTDIDKAAVDPAYR